MAERRRGLLRQTDQAKAQTRGILSIVELQAAINRYLAECQPRPAAIPLDKGPAQNYRSCQERAPSVRFYSLVEARKTGSDHQRVEFAGLASLTARNVPTCPPCLPDPLPFGPARLSRCLTHGRLPLSLVCRHVKLAATLAGARVVTQPVWRFLRSRPRSMLCGEKRASRQ
jgi:hypothetical protein